MAWLGIRLYLDENMDPRVADGLNQLGFDVTHAVREGNVRLADEEHLRYATTQGRACVSHNFSDFTRIHTEFLQRGEAHAGVVLVPHRSVSELIARLRHHLESHPPDQQQNNILWA
jgi:predicted nuclease of predicted toxin-antitoxin system